MSSAGEKRVLEEGPEGESKGEESKGEVVALNTTSNDGDHAEPASKRTRAEADAATTASAIGIQTATSNQAPSTPGSGPWPESMKPAVREKLESLFSSGRCRRDEIDLKIMQSIAEFPEAVGLQILSNFSDADMTSIRNKSAFLAGVMKRFRTELPLSTAHHAPTMGAYGPGLGGLSSAVSAETGGMLPSIHAKLEQIFASGKVFNRSCMFENLSIQRDYR
jgi:hypothetical protein